MVGVGVHTADGQLLGSMTDFQAASGYCMIAISFVFIITVPVISLSAYCPHLCVSCSAIVFSAAGGDRDSKES